MSRQRLNGTDCFKVGTVRVTLSTHWTIFAKEKVRHSHTVAVFFKDGVKVSEIFEVTL